MKKAIISIVLLTITILPSIAQDFPNVNKNYINPDKTLNKKEIIIPNIDGYQILKADFHIHTMFSDGNVWPRFRVQEAFVDGLDVISITDHIEYRPYKQHTNNDHNTSYELAKTTADEMGILLVKGTEITRKQGVLGHFNALFIEDANLIDVEDPKEAIKEAKRQGAFVILNHPGWAVDTCKITEFQQDLMNEDLIDGVEIFNNQEYYPRALSWSKDLELTTFSNSDAHAPTYDAYDYPDATRHTTLTRPMTFLFAKEKSLAGVREALDQRLTLAYFKGNLAGNEELLEKFFRGTISISKNYSNDKSTFYTIKNSCSIPYRLKIGNKFYLLNPLSQIVVSQKNEVKEINIGVTNFHYYEFLTPTYLVKLP